MRSKETHPSWNPNKPGSLFLIAILLCVVAALSYLSAVFAGALTLPGTLSPLWPGCAFLVGVLLCVPKKLWPVFLAAGLTAFFVHDIQSGLSVPTTLLLSVADTVEILVAAFAVSYFLGSIPHLNSIKRLTRYSLFAVLLAPASGAFLGAIALGTDYWAMWRISFFSEAIALLTLPPAIWGALNVAIAEKRKSIAYYLEAALLLGGLVSLGYFAFVASNGQSHPALLYSLVSLLLWSALRFGSVGVSSSILVVALLSIWGAVHGRGPFIGAASLSNVLSLQLFLLVAAIPFTTLAAIVEERKEAEQALRESEARERTKAKELETILDAVPIAVLISTDAKCERIRPNRSACELFRLDHGANASLSAPLDQRPKFKVLANGIEIPSEQLPIQRAAAGATAAFDVSESVVFDDGTERNLIANAVPLIGDDGKAYGAVAAMLDVTERNRAEKALRESEERFRLAAFAGKMFAYEWDVATDVIVRSGSVSAVLGPKAKTLLMRRSLVADVHPDDREPMADSIRERTPESPDVQISYRMLRPDGSVVWLEKTAHAFFDESGKLVRMVGMVADITQRKQAEEVLSGMSGKLIEAQERERVRIARDLHDDVAQRLALLTVGLEQLQQDIPASPSELRARVIALRDQTSQIATDVQAMSHELHSSKLEYLGLVAAMRSFCAEFSKQQKAEIDFRSNNVPAPLPSNLSLCLLRVLQESLHNAIKHSGVRHFEVQLEGAASEIQLTVRDIGIGFDTDAALKSQGLGLISMEERLKLVNGALVVDSGPKRGTTIHARVPLSSANDSMRIAG
ncbi:MAG TPA: PAS domain S-box protein [Candidatus Sulfotelmatobacter sp.]|nr:PAS domain S-box protein [Candidatus Sulfotelmatobacter sp.]